MKVCKKQYFKKLYVLWLIANCEKQVFVNNVCTTILQEHPVCIFCGVYSVLSNNHSWCGAAVSNHGPGLHKRVLEMMLRLTCRSCGVPWPSPLALWSGWVRSAVRWCSRCPVPLGHSLQVRTALCTSPGPCGWQMSTVDGLKPHHPSAAGTDST